MIEDKKKKKKPKAVIRFLLADATIIAKTSKGIGLLAKKTGITKNIRKSGSSIIKEADETLKQIKKAKKIPTEENIDKVIFKKKYLKEKQKDLLKKGKLKVYKTKKYWSK